MFLLCYSFAFSAFCMFKYYNRMFWSIFINKKHIRNVPAQPQSVWTQCCSWYEWVTWPILVNSCESACKITDQMTFAMTVCSSGEYLWLNWPITSFIIFIYLEFWERDDDDDDDDEEMQNIVTLREWEKIQLKLDEKSCQFGAFSAVCSWHDQGNHNCFAY